MQVFCIDRFLPDLPPGHRFPMPKYRLLRDQVQAAVPGLVLAEAEPASEGELALVHTPDYIAAVLGGTLSAAALREIGFPWSPRMVERARRSVGASIAAARAALREGVALQLAGGTHHAYPHKGSGYCVFNDVAVAARLMQVERHRGQRQLLRVWVIDLDVHQGNGTAAVFRDDPTVFTLSLHGARNFPFRKEASDLDVELADGCDDATYLTVLDAALAAAWQRQELVGRPDLAFFLAGADVHEGDRLGRLKLSLEGLRRRDQRVFDFLARQRVPVAVSMAGGYGREIGTTVAVHLQTVELARAAWAHWQGGDSRAASPVEESPR